MGKNKRRSSGDAAFPRPLRCTPKRPRPCGALWSLPLSCDCPRRRLGRERRRVDIPLPSAWRRGLAACSTFCSAASLTSRRLSLKRRTRPRPPAERSPHCHAAGQRGGPGRAVRPAQDVRVARRQASGGRQPARSARPSTLRVGARAGGSGGTRPPSAGPGPRVTAARARRRSTAARRARRGRRGAPEPVPHAGVRVRARRRAHKVVWVLSAGRPRGV